jgi:Calcineurin-like phosphoesterase superfamily domain
MHQAQPVGSILNRKLLGSQHDMRIRVLSDLHLEFKAWKPPKANADIVVLAGDIHVGVKGIEWARRSFPSIPIVYVAGNHEFYGEHIHDMTQDLLMEGRRLGVDVLDARSAVIGGVRFLGATLWTDFALGGNDPLNPSSASDLGNLMGPCVSLWIHGHRHESFDYVVNSTRVVCNPRGYAPMELNEAFDPVFTVDTRATSSSDRGVDE